MADAGFRTASRRRSTRTRPIPTRRSAPSIQQDLAADRDHGEIVTQEFATFLDTIETPHKAPIVYVGWFQDYPDPSDFIDPILSCASGGQGRRERRAVLQQGRRRPGGGGPWRGRLRPSGSPQYQDIQKTIMADAPWVPIRHQEWYTLISKRVGGFAIHPVWLYDAAQPVT